MRGYYPLGPTLLETGDVFGLHRRHRVIGKPVYVMVYPKVVPLAEVRLRLGTADRRSAAAEPPLRRPDPHRRRARSTSIGDPLQRVHWKVTARTGRAPLPRLRADQPRRGYASSSTSTPTATTKRGEPHRSELAVTTAASIAYAVSMLNQQLGLASNGRDAADRIREESLEAERRGTGEGYATRDEARERFELSEENDRIRPVVVETRRGFDQFQKIREALARLELSDALRLRATGAGDGLAHAARDATVIAVLPHVPAETAVALGTLRRQGFAVTAILIGLDESQKLEAHGRLLAETSATSVTSNTEEELAHLGGSTTAGRSPQRSGRSRSTRLAIPIPLRMTRPRLLAFAQLLRCRTSSPRSPTSPSPRRRASPCLPDAAGASGATAVLLALASGCLYLAGMVWNDFFDLAEDAKARAVPPAAIRPRLGPHRGPSRRRSSFALGLALRRRCAGCRAHGDGITAARLRRRHRRGVLALRRRDEAHAGRPGGDGACRFLNVLLGLSLIPETAARLELRGSTSPASSACTSSA